MLESLKEHIRDFNSDFDFDFDLSDVSFLNWLRSLLMMLGAYWLAVAVPMAIVNLFRPDTVVIERRDGGEITYTLNGKKVSRDKVPADLLKPFFDDGSDYSEVLSFPPKSK